VAPEHIVLIPVGAGDAKTIADPGFQYQMAAWFPDSKRLLLGAAVQGHGPRVYVRDVSGGPPRPLTREGVRIRTSYLLTNGKLAAVQDADRRWWLYPVDGGEPRPLPGGEPGDVVVRFDSTGSAVFVAKGGPVLPLRIDRLELPSGKRTFWKEITPADPTGVTEINGVHLTPDGKGYCYNYMRALSRLYLVEGLR
jgi:hypothetical protein